MLVTKKKRSIQTRRGRGTRFSNQQLDSSSKVTKNKEGPLSNSLTPFKPELTFQFNVGHALVAVGEVKKTSESRDFEHA